MKTLVHSTEGRTCTQSITVVIDDTGVVRDITFSGNGCQGNLIALRRLLIGKTTTEIIEQMGGIMCRNRGTSCMNELAQCLKQYTPITSTEPLEDCYFHNSGECMLHGGTCNGDCIYTKDPKKYEKRVMSICNNPSILLGK